MQKEFNWSALNTFLVVVLLVAGMFVVANINGNIADTRTQLDNKIDNKFDTSLKDIQDVASALKDVDTTVEVNPGICDNIDGCNGWRISSSYRNEALDRVNEELQEDENRDLFRNIQNFFSDLDDNEDITKVTLHKIGKVRANEELDLDFDLSDTLEITVEYVLKVKYNEDGSGDSNTEYVKVTAVVTDLEDGISEGEVRNIDVVEWDNDWALTSN